MRELYVQKSKEYSERTNTFCEFLVELVSAAVGGTQKTEGVVGLDDGSGLEDIPEAQLQDLKDALGTDFARMYPDYE